MADPRRFVPILRRATLILAALMVVWIISRFSTYTLEGDESIMPMRFDPGQVLLLDKRPRSPQVGDAWLVRTEAGQLALGVVRKMAEDSMAVEFGRTVGVEANWIWLSTDLGRARVLMPLPF